jgi:hypothetical protein
MMHIILSITVQMITVIVINNNNTNNSNNNSTHNYNATNMIRMIIILLRINTILTAIRITIMMMFNANKKHENAHTK